jgi:flagellar hook assembly protein FlgD
VNEPNVSLFKETIYPNPAADKVTFSFVNANYSDVVIRIYDLNGKVLESLNTGIASKGLHEFTWSVSSKHKSGMYVYEISNNATPSRGKLMITK